MKLEWVTPAVYGAGVGAIALAVIGFSWGGWVTAGSAMRMAGNASVNAVVAAMTPYCVAQYQSAPDSGEVLAALKAASTSYERSSIIEKAGWATPLGSEKPNRALAVACGTAIAST